jgi:hypothetical protein
MLMREEEEISCRGLPRATAALASGCGVCGGLLGKDVRISLHQNLSVELDEKWEKVCGYFGVRMSSIAIVIAAHL